MGKGALVHFWRRIAHQRGWGNSLLLGWASRVYSLGVHLRLSCYERGLFRKRRLPCRVVSIGNLTVGGTGKTPFVIAIARDLRHRGEQVGVVSRGYRGIHGDEILLVSDGKRIFHSPERVGEEPYLIASRSPGVPVVVGKNRYRAAQHLLSRYPLTTIILDDGFQHVSLERDLDLLLIDATDPFGNRGLLPSGPLREPVSSLRRAGAIILTRVDRHNGCGSLVEEIKGYAGDRPILYSSFSPTALIDLQCGEEREVHCLSGRPVVAFSGVGNPSSFVASLKEGGVWVKAEITYPDHHRYTHRDVGDIIEAAEREGVRDIVTTEKDGVKVARLFPHDIPLWALRIDLATIEDHAEWEDLLEKK